LVIDAAKRLARSIWLRRVSASLILTLRGSSHRAQNSLHRNVGLTDAGQLIHGDITARQI
jgi:hypothetical protein